MAVPVRTVIDDHFEVSRIVGRAIAPRRGPLAREGLSALHGGAGEELGRWRYDSRGEFWINELGSLTRRTSDGE